MTDALVRIRDLCYEAVGVPDWLTPVYIELDSASVDNAPALQAQLDALPNGIPGYPTTAILPAGEYAMKEVGPFTGVALRDKQHVRLTGPAVLRWSDYGPYNSATAHWERRHFVIADCHDVEVSGLTILGEHEELSQYGGQRAKYIAAHEYQHGFEIARSTDIILNDLTVEQVGGDGFYLNDVIGLKSENVTVTRNGRQGIGGVLGSDWYWDGLTITHSARSGIDWEPNGGVDRVDRTTFINSFIRGSTLGVQIQRGTDLTIRDSTVEGRIKLSSSGGSLHDRNVTLDNLDLYVNHGSVGRDSPIIQAVSFGTLSVTNCRASKPTGDIRSELSAFIRLYDPSLHGHLIVRDNVATNYVTAVQCRLSDAEKDVLVAASTFDIGNNDLGNGIVEGMPDWIASRTGTDDGN